MRLFAIVLIPVCAALLLAQSAGAKPDTVKGKSLFVKYGCFECHGTLGQGTSAGARLAPRPPALARMIAYVRNPSGQMPPYTSKVVSDADLADIRAFLTAIPEPPPAKSIPLLNQ